MKILFIVVSILTSTAVYGAKKHKELSWIHAGIGFQYKGIAGVQANIYGRIDLLCFMDKNIKLSVFNRSSTGGVVLGHAWHSNTSTMAQIRIGDSEHRSYGFSYAFGYTSNVTSIITDPRMHRFSGFGTHQLGISAPNDKEYFISMQACKYFKQTIFTLEIGITKIINRSFMRELRTTF